MAKWYKIQEKLTNIPKPIVIFIIMLWVMSTILAVHSLLQPQYIEKKIQTNLITQRTNFEYKAEELPNGIENFRGLIFPRYHKEVTVSINSIITSQEPVVVKGDYSIVLRLIADGLWQQDIPLTEKQIINIEGEENQIIKEEVVINLEKIYNDTETIANEIIGLRPNRYILKIQPIIEGEILYENKAIELDTTPEITFEFTQSQVALAEGQEMEFAHKTPIEESNIEEQSLNILGIERHIYTWRYIFSFICFLISLLLIVILISKRKKTKKIMTKNEKIEKKYKNRLVIIGKQIDISNKCDIPIESFKSLVRIADEKDQGILEYNDDIQNKTYYYVIDGSYIYSHIVYTIPKVASQEHNTENV